MSRFSKILSVALASFAMAACSQTAKVDGTFDGAPSSDVVVKLLDMNKFLVLDTLKTDAKGHFS
jgi:hypothetical protein